jgi:hypothetical protein
MKHFYALTDFACQAEVTQLHITILIDENVIWLEIPIHNIFAMQLLKGENHASDNEAWSLFSRLSKEYLLVRLL